MEGRSLGCDIARKVARQTGKIRSLITIIQMGQAFLEWNLSQLRPHVKELRNGPTAHLLYT